MSQSDLGLVPVMPEQATAAHQRRVHLVADPTACSKALPTEPAAGLREPRNKKTRSGTLNTDRFQNTPEPKKAPKTTHTHTRARMWRLSFFRVVQRPGLKGLGGRREDRSS